MGHTQIKAEDWPVIAKMLRVGYTGSEIARIINKDPSAVNRHIANNGGRESYDVREVGRQKRLKRIKAMESIRKLKGALLRTVVQMLKGHQSPEQISGVLKKKGKQVDTSTIYRYIEERAPHLKSKEAWYQNQRKNARTSQETTD